MNQSEAFARSSQLASVEGKCRELGMRDGESVLHFLVRLHEERDSAVALLAPARARAALLHKLFSDRYLVLTLSDNYSVGCDRFLQSLAVLHQHMELCLKRDVPRQDVVLCTQPLLREIRDNMRSMEAGAKEAQAQLDQLEREGATSLLRRKLRRKLEGKLEDGLAWFISWGLGR